MENYFEPNKEEKINVSNPPCDNFAITISQIGQSILHVQYRTVALRSLYLLLTKHWKTL
jgi:hypothetical protein